MIIDSHVHTFPKEIAAGVLHGLGVDKARILPFSDGTMEGLKKNMKKAGISYSVNLPVPTNMKQVKKLNRIAIETKEQNFSEGIINFGGMHPAYEDYKTILKDLASHGIRGIKIHPSYMGIDIDDIRFMRVIDAASDLGLAVVTHAGIDIGIYDHNYCSVDHILKIIDQVQPKTFILAHMGNWGYWDDVEKYLCGAPVWFDTAFSLGKIFGNPESKQAPYAPEKMRSEQFVRICRKHGVDRILFATDSPWADPQIELRQLRETDFTEGELALILGENASKLLGL